MTKDSYFNLNVRLVFSIIRLSNVQVKLIILTL